MSTTTHTTYTCDMCGKVATTEQSADHWFHVTTIRDRTSHTLLMIIPYDQHFCDSMCAIAGLAGRFATQMDVETLGRVLAGEIQQRRAARQERTPPPDMGLCSRCGAVCAYKDMWIAPDKRPYCASCEEVRTRQQ